MAGSVHGVEIPLVVDALATIRGVMPAVRALIAPRFLSDVRAIEDAAAARGLGTDRFSRRAAADARRADVVVLDTYGDLLHACAVATWTFLGGSVVKIDLGLGQNLLEPLAQSAPVFFGPHMGRWTALTSALLEIFPGLAVQTADDLAKGVLALAAEPGATTTLHSCAEALMARGTAAAARHVEAIHDVLRDVRPSYGTGAPPSWQPTSS